MSWDTAWGNSWGNSWGDAVLLVLAETVHTHAVDSISYFVIPELRFVGELTDSSGAVTLTGLQCVVFAGTDIYTASPVLQASSISVTGGQIGIQSQVFRLEDIGSDYLVTLYDPGPPLRGGGPHPATVVNVNA